MISKWYGLKSKATKMRTQGVSIREIEIKLGIPRSTLSGWFKHIKLTKIQKDALYKQWLRGVGEARKKAVKWHNLQKANRLETAEKEARQVIDEIDLNNKQQLELALAMLYLGEGFKKSIATGIGNSDPLILTFFITILKKVYGVGIDKITCNLHLRADQNSDELKKYWSQTLGVPLMNFKGTSVDKRTEGSTTYDSYKGVCVVRCGNVAIQRKLVYLSRIYCQKIIESMRD